MGKNTFFEQGFSAADCVLVARFGVAEAYGSPVAAAFPGLRRWFESLVQRPARKQA